jgi:hypothetical protein
VQVPQLASVWPHPLGGAPHVAPRDSHVAGVQVVSHWKLPPQTVGEAHVPQPRTDPHPSGGLPQLAPSDAQVAGSQTHAPAALHVAGAAQAPHESVLPQPSVEGPHVLPCCAHVAGVQPQAFGAGFVPPPHVAGGVHVPHATTPPQPSDTMPQFPPAHATATDSGVHGVAAHAVPVPPSTSVALQFAPASHDPHSSRLPQPSGARPHAKWIEPHDVGSQPQAAEPFMFVTHTWPALQVPQLRKCPQPSLCVPQLAPRVGHVAPTHAQAP